MVLGTETEWVAWLTLDGTSDRSVSGFLSPPFHRKSRLAILSTDPDHLRSPVYPDRGLGSPERLNGMETVYRNTREADHPHHVPKKDGVKTSTVDTPMGGRRKEVE